jgi:predicted signal transduction protein with EAL and GGDEF domain
MPYQGLNVSATMSIGVANTIPGTNESRDALIARADKALYQAKREGRNRTIVAPWIEPSQQQSPKFDVSRDTVAPFNE